MVDSVLSPGVSRHLRASDAARPRPAAATSVRDGVRGCGGWSRPVGFGTAGLPRALTSPWYVRPYRPRHAATAFRDHRSTESTIYAAISHAIAPWRTSATSSAIDAGERPNEAAAPVCEHAAWA